MRLIVASAIAMAFLVVGCGQQAQADLAVCKSDLARVQAEATSAKTTADQKIAALEAELQQAKDQLAANQKASDDAAMAAEEAEAANKAAAGKAAAQKRATNMKKAAELKEAVEKADVKAQTQTPDATTQQKAKAAGF